jgi:outer membrane receptor protein involved in Fe transport
MARISFSPRTLAFVAFLVGLPPAAFSEDEHIDEVLVTATRRAASESDVSSALSLVDADALRSNKLVTDALAEGPGVFLQQTTPGQGAPIIRGQKGSAVLHLVDGMRLNNAIFRSAPTQYLALVPVTAIERVEVLRGTPASLYGSDAVGGVVQLVTRVPNFDSMNTEVRGEAFAAFDTAERGRVVRGVLDIGNQRVASSFSGEYLKTGDRRVGGGDEIGPSGYESKAGRVLMSVTPDDRRSWLFDIHFLEQPSTPRVDELVPGFGQTEPSSSEFFFEPNRRLFAHVRYDVVSGPADLDWRIDASWQRIEDDRVTRDFQSSTRRLESNSSDLTGAMISASRQIDAGSWIVGLEYYHDRVSSSRASQDIASGQILPAAARYPDGSTVDQGAIFANADYAVSERNRLSGGLRVSSVDITMPRTLVSAAANISVSDGSGDIGWLFDLSEEWQLVSNIGLGFRAPNVFDLGTLGSRPGNRFNIPNTNLESERALQFDAGMRYRSGRSEMEFILYTLQYDDRITSVLTGDVTPDGRDVVQSVNAADSTVRGVEFGLESHLTDALSASAVLNYTWGEQTVAGVTEAGDRIPPLSGRFRLLWSAGGTMSYHASANFSDTQDRLSSRDIRDIRIDPNGTAGWGIVGLGATWRPNGDWEVTANADNILDKRYRSHGSGIDAPGRNLSVSVRRIW